MPDGSNDAEGATIEIQWTDSRATSGGKKGSRGHIDGLGLFGDEDDDTEPKKDK
jgi:hypothetical protein